MTNNQPIKINPREIPVCDITPLLDGTNPLKVARELHEASQKLGFIYIKGHGISDAVSRDARAAAYKFFRATDTEKETVRISPKHRGWIGCGGAKMQNDDAPDLKESFLWGHQDAAGNTPEDHPLRGVNLWPKFVPTLEQNAMNYFEHAHVVARHLMRGFALGLELDENFFLRTSSAPLSRGSFVYYPHQPKNLPKPQFGVGPHTDFGVLTVLNQDNVGGLQVQNRDGEWIEAPPIEGTLIVNVADLLSRWTNGAYVSTPHRVINSSGRERLSLVLAFDPNPETLIDAGEIYGVADQEPITCGDYLEWRFEQAFSYRKGLSNGE